MWKQIKALKYKADLGAYTSNSGFFIFYQVPIDFPITEQFAFDINATLINLLQVIDAT